MKTLYLFAILFATPAISAAEKPNIIVIMADDLGYGDLSCYGATVFQTPHIDRLAKEGQRFTSASPAVTARHRPALPAAFPC